MILNSQTGVAGITITVLSRGFSLQYTLIVLGNLSSAQMIRQDCTSSQGMVPWFMQNYPKVQ